MAHRHRREFLTSTLSLAVAACGAGGVLPTAPTAARSWRMGFGINPPRITVEDVVRGIDTWSARSEIGAIHEELPWRDLLAGQSPDAILERDKLQLIRYLRGKGQQIYFMADPTDGLDRAQEAPQLRALGRSLAEPAIQRLYRDYVLAVARVLSPDYLGLAAETNLVRALAPSAVYGAVVRAASETNAALRSAGFAAPIFVSVQVETAWGVLGGNGPYDGVARDLSDFPFTRFLGLSSYPYFAYAQPADIPNDYYRRLLNGHSLRLMVVEGGWASATAGTVRSSPEIQARYVQRHGELLDDVHALGVIQLVFADLELASFPQPIPPTLPLFATIGLTDSRFGAKPALAAWDAQHSRPLATA